MVRKICVNGYEEVKAALDAEKNHDGPIYILFTGSKDTEGKSWCSDCVTVEPVIEQALNCASDNSVFLQCQVGNRESWKDSSNAFRKDNIFKLSSVPTLIKWKENKRLEESQLFNLDLVKMLFEED